MTRERWMAWLLGALLVLGGVAVEESFLMVTGVLLLVTIAILGYVRPR